MLFGSSPKLLVETKTLTQEALFGKAYQTAAGRHMQITNPFQVALNLNDCSFLIILDTWNTSTPHNTVFYEDDTVLQNRKFNVYK